MLSRQPCDLLDATAACDVDRVKELVDAGADVNQGDGYDTPLGGCIGVTWDKEAEKQSSDAAQVQIIDYLLQHGADPNRPAYGGHTPVSLMAFHAKPAALKRLLDCGGDSNLAHPKTGETPLHSVTGKAWNPGANECVRLLLEAGADPNAKAAVDAETDHFWRDICVVGETPLHRAAAYGDEEMIRLLIGAGADPSIKDSRGDSALTWFSRHQRDKPHVRVDAKAMVHLGYGKWKDTLKAFER
ncbi:MAG: hypothetical protein CMJ19_17280 [Phycisphaeraceae bacterium]|nr:hypothetical protein [Phycisphaeraceae bacterium]